MTLDGMVLARRKKLGWTQEDLEGESGVSVWQISMIEGNLARPELDTVRKLEAALGIPLMGAHVQPGPGRVTKEELYARAGKAVRKFRDEAVLWGLRKEDIADALESALSELRENGS